MPNNYYGYQYDTNPRKLNVNYDKPKKKKTATTKKNQNKKQVSKAKPKTNKQKIQEAKAQKKADFKIKFSIGYKTVIIFAIIFGVLFREAQINEKFSKIQSLKSSITTLQKENDQLEINIQNSINTNRIEQKAKEILGMQKLTSRQIVYINLPKKDYVEHRTEEVIIEEEKSWFETFLENITKRI